VQVKTTSVDVPFVNTTGKMIMGMRFGRKKPQKAPVQVEVRNGRPRTTDGQRATPDKTIRGAIYDDRYAEEERRARLTKLQKDQKEITAWVERYRSQNDPDALREVAAQQIARAAVDEGVRVQVIVDPRDPRMVVRPHHKSQFGEMVQNTNVLLPEATGTHGVVTNPEFRTNDPSWAYYNDTRKVTKA
jgi:hypothetical protein